MNDDVNSPINEDLIKRINESSIKCNIGPMMLHRYATEYLESANSITSRMKKSPAKIYLYSHSVELCLKSYLASTGLLSAEIKSKYGHRFSNLWTAAVDRGINDLVTLTDREAEVFSKIDESNHLGFTLRYPHGSRVGGSPEFPDEETIKAVASKMVTGLKEHCFDIFPIPDNYVFAEAEKPGAFTMIW